MWRVCNKGKSEIVLEVGTLEVQDTDRALKDSAVSYIRWREIQRKVSYERKPAPSAEWEDDTDRARNFEDRVIITNWSVEEGLWRSRQIQQRDKTVMILGWKVNCTSVSSISADITHCPNLKSRYHSWLSIQSLHSINYLALIITPPEHFSVLRFHFHSPSI